MLLKDLKQLNWTEVTEPMITETVSKLFLGDASKLEEFLRSHDFSKPEIFRNELTGDYLAVTYTIALDERVLNDAMLLSIRHDIALNVLPDIPGVIAMVWAKKGTHERVLADMLGVD